VKSSPPHIIKEVFLTLNLGQSPLKIRVFIADITEFILGLDILRAYDASVDTGCQHCPAEEGVSLWSPGVGPRPFSLVVAKPAQRGGIIMATLESPLGVENGLVEPSPQAHLLEGIYIARTLVEDRQEVPVSLEYQPLGPKAYEGIPSGTL
jgi:hypothetical protein